jgi:cytochrome c553
MRLLTLGACVTLLALSPMAAGAEEGELSMQEKIRLGQAKSAQCAQCHGLAGVTDNPTFPNLAGQHAGYLSRQLELFRSRERFDNLMSPVAESLSDEDIEQLSLFYRNIGE